MTPHPINMGNGTLGIVYSKGGYPDSLMFSKTIDDGETWGEPTLITQFVNNYPSVSISAIRTTTGRLLLYLAKTTENSYQAETVCYYSDNDGITWAEGNSHFTSPINFRNPRFSVLTDSTLIISGISGTTAGAIIKSTDDGDTWSVKTYPFRPADFCSISASEYLVLDNRGNQLKLFRSTDAGNSWDGGTLIFHQDSNVVRPQFRLSPGELEIIYSRGINLPSLTDTNIYSVVSFDDGVTWNSPQNITTYEGYDAIHNVSFKDSSAFITFISDRLTRKKNLYYGKLDQSIDNPPPRLYDVRVDSSFVRASVSSNSPLIIFNCKYWLNNNGPFIAEMFDDGQHNDLSPGDNVWGCTINSSQFLDQISCTFYMQNAAGQIYDSLFGIHYIEYSPIDASKSWLSIGELQNWYYSLGTEPEGASMEQQEGLHFPSQKQYQDNQVSKALWLGAKDFTDEFNDFYPHKVIPIGPRQIQSYLHYPKIFKKIAKFERPVVTVDDQESFLRQEKIDEIDPSLPFDQMIYNEINTQLGITLKRKIYQFSQSFNDNYIINEYTLINTGNTDLDNFIELPAQTLNGVYLFNLFRWAICKDTRYNIGNATGWGMNTMLDARGDGVMPDPPHENFRAQFAWHGYFPPFTLYDNIGGPKWVPSGVPGSYQDTTGRLGAPQFVGVVTLHADRSGSDHSDDILQPKTTGYFGSDSPPTGYYNPPTKAQMTTQYQWMKSGHYSPRHAYVVEPNGNFDEPTGDPSLGTPGGFSAGNGYGPYNLSFGDSIKIVFAEAVDGLGWEESIDIGRKYKNGLISSAEKNQSVMTGRDSLFKTFRNAIENYNSGNGFVIPQPPLPPSYFTVTSDSFAVSLNWGHSGTGPAVTGFEIFRATENWDNEYELIHTTDNNMFSYSDTDISLGEEYFYYILSVGDSADNNGAANTPLGSLRSSRYYTQTYHAANGLITKVEDENLEFNFSLNQNYPNPFNSETVIKFSLKENSKVKLQVFNILGEEVKLIIDKEMPAGNHEQKFIASDISSGVYFYTLTADNRFIGAKKLILLK